MRNVYDEIRSFYDEYEDFNFVLEKNVVEGYCRQKAWQGVDLVELAEKWQRLVLFFRYLLFLDADSFAELDENTCIGYFAWQEEYGGSYKITAEVVKLTLADLADLSRYLLKRKISCNLDAIKNTEQAFFKNGEFAFPELPEENLIVPEMLKRQENVSEELTGQLNMLLEKLLKKIGIYYKGEVFAADFNRAMTLYAGPVGIRPEEDDEDFWLGFWNYFLLDYHLKVSDLTPLHYFYKVKASTLSADERYIIEDLLKTKFTVFYVRRVCPDYMLECVDLLTEEIFEMPMPEYGVSDYKKTLLYGHVYNEGVVMLNYITSVVVSNNLRKRIREEILRQQALFSRQGDDTMALFLERHAVLVRHMIDILVNLAKVNVGMPSIDKTNLLVPENVIADECLMTELRTLALKNGLSKFSLELLLRMGRDYGYFADKKGSHMSVKLAAAAMFMSFALINGINTADSATLSRQLSISEREFTLACNEVVKVLQLRIFEPRYLTEEGFVISLYAF